MNTIEFVISRIRHLVGSPVTVIHSVNEDDLHSFVIKDNTKPDVTILLDTSDLALHLFEIDRLIEPQLEQDEFNSRVGTDVRETARAKFQRRVGALVQKMRDKGQLYGDVTVGSDIPAEQLSTMIDRIQSEQQAKRSK